VTGYPEVIPPKCGSVRIGDNTPGNADFRHTGYPPKRSLAGQVGNLVRRNLLVEMDTGGCVDPPACATHYDYCLAIARFSRCPGVMKRSWTSVPRSIQPLSPQPCHPRVSRRKSSYPGLDGCPTLCPSERGLAMILAIKGAANRLQPQSGAKGLLTFWRSQASNQ
jgi:hypothetical protein